MRSSSSSLGKRERRGEGIMIDGLKVQMTTEALRARLADRIAWHQRAAAEFEAEWRRPEGDRDDPPMPGHMLEHEMREHQEQAGLLELLRDHLVPGEIYQLGEMDLRFADLVPEFQVEWPAPLRRATDARAVM
jgi:hypothetical protein